MTDCRNQSHSGASYLLATGWGQTLGLVGLIPGFLILEKTQHPGGRLATALVGWARRLTAGFPQGGLTPLACCPGDHPPLSLQRGLSLLRRIPLRSLAIQGPPLSNSCHRESLTIHGLSLPVCHCPCGLQGVHSLTRLEARRGQAACLLHMFTVLSRDRHFRASPPGQQDAVVSSCSPTKSTPGSRVLPRRTSQAGLWGAGEQAEGQGRLRGGTGPIPLVNRPWPTSSQGHRPERGPACARHAAQPALHRTEGARLSH